MKKRLIILSDKFRNPWDGDKNGSSNDDFEDLFKKGQEKISDIFGGRRYSGGNGGNGGGMPDFVNKKLLWMAAATLFTAWILSGFYTIQPDEEGVVMTLGKYSRTTPSGLNYKLPEPIETVTKISVTRVNKEEVGFRSAGKRITTREQLLQSTVSSESQMLTTDENIVDINFEVQWLINNSRDYLFNVRDLANENTVKTVAESAMREIIGLTKITDVLAEERSKIEQDAKKLMQNMLDNYHMGVKVLRVQLLRVDPPQEVVDAYRDVQNAKQDKEREINKAYAYRNDIIPRARGQAESMLQEAEAYRQRVIAEAAGDAQRFSSVYEQYKNAKEVTRTRMYLETMEEVLSGVDKVILDKGSANNLLPFLQLGKNDKNTDSGAKQ
ncbi:MAG: putative integral rane proteinase [Candidatus Midichloriaceae bacterium]|jgi:membrane protease subunit HflK|nr:putative integral rane proteinase [Candidatus Midichloriaceae bacterium]